MLYLREVNSYLALVCLLRADNLTKRGLIDYNIDCFKRALAQIFDGSGGGNGGSNGSSGGGGGGGGGVEGGMP